MKRTVSMKKGITAGIRLANKLWQPGRTLYLSHDYETLRYTVSDVNPLKEHTIVINEPQPIFRYVKVK